MQLEDRLSIDTPEGVSIEVALAGLGSRFGAAAIDILIQGALLLAATLAMSLAGSAVEEDLGIFLLGVGTLLVALVVIGYYVLFEALNGGRTPGKAALGIRVASIDGTPLSLGAVTLRTVMRLIDFLPAAYAVGAISIAVTARNQRLGDLLADTVVIRDRRPALTSAVEPTAAAHGWDVATVSTREVELVRRFVARRPDLTPEARDQLAGELARRIRPRVRGGEQLGNEEFLVQLLSEKQ